MSSSLLAIDPGITSFKGVVALSWDYRDGTTAYNYGGVYHNPNIPYNNGVNISGRFKFNLDYDLNNDGNWVTCTLIDGTSASSADIDDTLSWHIFKTAWNAIGITDSDSCKLRCRVYNVLTDTWSSYAYFGPFDIASLGYPFFTADINGDFYSWVPSASNDYPTPILNVTPNVTHKISVRGNIETVKYAQNIQKFTLDFPSLSAADITSFKSFMQSIDYRKNTFRYYQLETNYESPFDRTWQYTNVKLDEAKLGINYERTGRYSLSINLRKVQ